MRRLFVLTALCFALPANGVTIDWVEVSDPGNACEVQPPTGPVSGGCFGAVDYVYRIAKYEVTNAQYAEFLNAVAASDTYELYDPNMASGFGGITRSGSPGSYSYSTIPSREIRPVADLTFWDALRFANWLHNGQLSGAQDATTTEDGAYTLTPEGMAANLITRNPGATIFLPSEDEWYKAAYFNGTSFYDYPAGTDSQTVCAAAGSTPNTANCGMAVGDFTHVGQYTGSPSPYGTFDQGGNAGEWNEAIVDEFYRGWRGVAFNYEPEGLAAASRSSLLPTSGGPGFRVAMIPEPTTALLLACGLAGLAVVGRRLSLR